MPLFEESSQAELHGSASCRRVLFVSYHFPPVGGAGVQRPVKFVKYLREYGWEASVLAAANPSVPVFDDTLCRDVPEDTVVVRARTWEPGYAAKKQAIDLSQSGESDKQSQRGRANGTRRPFSGRIKSHIRRAVFSTARMLLQPDPQILWLPNARRAGCRLLSSLRHDAIVATAPPYSNLILGALLKRHSGLPLVLDFRDEWDLSGRHLENVPKDRFSRAVQSRLQRWVLRQADAVLATTEASTRQLEQRGRVAGSRARFVCIRNGFDIDDFAHLAACDEPLPAERPFRLVYTGTLWNLTSVAPLVLAVERIAAQRPELLHRFEPVFVGRRTPAQQQWLDRLGRTGCRLTIHDYCRHEEALTRAYTADALCLLLSEAEGADRVIPAKLFEYLALGRALLAIVPEGEAAGIIRRFDSDAVRTPDDVAGIAQWLEWHIANPVTQPDRKLTDDRLVPFTRRSQAGELAALLEELSGAQSAAPFTNQPDERQQALVAAVADEPNGSRVPCSF